MGAPPEIAGFLDEIRRENGGFCKGDAISTCLGADPELDEFMVGLFVSLSPLWFIYFRHSGTWIIFFFSDSCTLNLSLTSYSTTYTAVYVSDFHCGYLCRCGLNP